VGLFSGCDFPRASGYNADAAGPAIIWRLKQKATAVLIEAFSSIVAELILRTEDDREKAALRLAHGRATLGARS
jgi:hypothetical protein